MDQTLAIVDFPRSWVNELLVDQFFVVLSISTLSLLDLDFWLAWVVVTEILSQVVRFPSRVILHKVEVVEIVSARFGNLLLLFDSVAVSLPVDFSASFLKLVDGTLWQTTSAHLLDSVFQECAFDRLNIQKEAEAIHHDPCWVQHHLLIGHEKCWGFLCLLPQVVVVFDPNLCPVFNCCRPFFELIILIYWLGTMCTHWVSNTLWHKQVKWVSNDANDLVHIKSWQSLLNEWPVRLCDPAFVLSEYLLSKESWVLKSELMNQFVIAAREYSSNLLKYPT